MVPPRIFWWLGWLYVVIVVIHKTDMQSIHYFSISAMVPHIFWWLGWLCVLIVVIHKTDAINWTDEEEWVEEGGVCSMFECSCSAGGWISSCKKNLIPFRFRPLFNNDSLCFRTSFITCIFSPGLKMNSVKKMVDGIFFSWKHRVVSHFSISPFQWIEATSKYYRSPLSKGTDMRRHINYGENLYR